MDIIKFLICIHDFISVGKCSKRYDEVVVVALAVHAPGA